MFAPKRFILILGMLLSFACNDSGLTLSSDSSIILTLNPETVNLDPTAGVNDAVVEVQVQTLDLSGSPLGGVTVLLNTSSGLLADTSLETDPQGRGITTLTVTTADAGEVSVRAQSAAVQDIAPLIVAVIAGNQPPVAAIITAPNNEQDANLPVLFDGSFSNDPDGVITCYQWEIVSDFGPSNEVVQGPGVTALDRTYTVAQNLIVFLRVSDDPVVGIDCIAGGTAVDPSRFNGSAQTPYLINCQNPVPIAEAGNDLNVPIQNAGTVFLDGSGSTDNGPIEKYQWNCGNGQPPVVTDPTQPWMALCRYFAAGSYTATLTVFDQGDGTLDPGNGAFGDWNCQKSSSDTLIVTVFIP
jgi:hypothetical protein